MIVSLKIIIDEDKTVSIIIYKTAELAELLENLIVVLEISFPNVRITTQNDHYHIAGISRVGTFATIKSFIEEVYIRFIDEDVDNDDSEFDEFFMM